MNNGLFSKRTITGNSDKKVITNCPTGCEAPLKDNKKYAKNVKSNQFLKSTNRTMEYKK